MALLAYQELEKRFAAFTGSEFAVSCNTGTASLHLALRAVGVKRGDEVILPDFTMAACTYAVEYCGATPIYVDCDNNLNMDPDKIEEKITKKTKAIMPAHIYGRPCDMDRIMRIARLNNLKVVEDCSEAHGGSYKGRPLGTWGDIGCFSLYQNKIVSAEEGGICVTNNEALAETMRFLKNMAFTEKHDFFHPILGYNYRMPNAQAILALRSLRGVKRELNRRKALRLIYDYHLGPLSIDRPSGSVDWVYDFLPGRGFQQAVVDAIPGARHFFKPNSTFFFTPETEPGFFAKKYSEIGAYLPMTKDITPKKARDYGKRVADMLL